MSGLLFAFQLKHTNDCTRFQIEIDIYETPTFRVGYSRLPTKSMKPETMMRAKLPPALEWAVSRALRKLNEEVRFVVRMDVTGLQSYRRSCL